MNTVQDELLTWVAREDGVVGVFIFAVGLVIGFFGFRLFLPIVALLLGGGGWLAGAVLAEQATLPPLICSGAAAVTLLVVGLKWRRAGEVFGGGVLFVGLGLYLAQQLGLEDLWLLIVTGVIGLFGFLFALLCPRTNPLAVTTLLGSVLILTGLVGFTSDYFPAFGQTLRSWARSWSLLMPVLIGMFVAMTYSYQELHKQGDMRSGA